MIFTRQALPSQSYWRGKVFHVEFVLKRVTSWHDSVCGAAVWFCHVGCVLGSDLVGLEINSDLTSIVDEGSVNEGGKSDSLIKSQETNRILTCSRAGPVGCIGLSFPCGKWSVRPACPSASTTRRVLVRHRPARPTNYRVHITFRSMLICAPGQLYELFIYLFG